MNDERREREVRELWEQLSALVLDNQRRRDVAEALQMPFGRARALRRIATRPMTMRELADAIGVDAPNATAVVDALAADGLVRREPSADDRRCRVVSATPRGARLAQLADDILSAPPAALYSLNDDTVSALREALQPVSTAQRDVAPTA